MADFTIFQRSVYLETTPEAAYSFHEDPRNISKISPRSLKVHRVECSLPARAGENFLLDVSQFGLHLEWVGFWEDAVANSTPILRLVDGAKKSPFRHWRHHHLFLQRGDGTLMTDRVEYALPGGFLGRLLDLTVMRVIFVAVFHARHRATQRFFASPKDLGGTL
jgi:hypothetical protein